MILAAHSASTLQVWGAGVFGAVLGWYLSYLNRWHTGEVGVADLVTVIGALGGGGILAVFPAKSDLFGAYGIGLGAGFFAYFFVLLVIVLLSKRIPALEFFVRPPEGQRPLADDQRVN
jgi:hypothetical protein